MTSFPTDFWTPTASNELHLPDASILIGVPLGQELSEHSHDFIQISACFHTRKADVRREEKAPDYFSRPGSARAVPIGMQHRGGWSTGLEVVVVHLRESLINLAADELRALGSLNLEFGGISADLFVLQLLKAAGREMRTRAVASRAYFESLVHRSYREMCASRRCFRRVGGTGINFASGRRGKRWEMEK